MDANDKDASNTLERQQKKGRYCTQESQQQSRYQEQHKGTLSGGRTSARAWTPAKAGSTGTGGTVKQQGRQQQQGGSCTHIL
jgi:hypothetical protein